MLRQLCYVTLVGFELAEILFASDPWVLGSQVYTTTCDPKVSES